MVGLDQLEYKIDNNILSFEKGKIYCVKVYVYDYPKEFIDEYCKCLIEVFNKNGIEIIVIPIIDGQMDLEFFKTNESEKEEIKK